VIGGWIVGDDAGTVFSAGEDFVLVALEGGLAALLLD
jgi:hypothetical protein